MLRKILIIGMGSRYGGDDQIGLTLADQLQKNLKNESKINHEIEIWKSQDDPLNILEKWAHRQLVVIIDAFYDESSPIGTIKIWDENSLLTTSLRTSSHVINLTELIQLGKTLGQFPQKLIIIGIKSQNFKKGEVIHQKIVKSSLKVKKYLIALFRKELTEILIKKRSPQNA